MPLTLVKSMVKVKAPTLSSMASISDSFSFASTISSMPFALDLSLVDWKYFKPYFTAGAAGASSAAKATVTVPRMSTRLRKRLKILVDTFFICFASLNFTDDKKV